MRLRSVDNVDLLALGEGILFEECAKAVLGRRPIRARLLATSVSAPLLFFVLNFS